jgi:hypothetical protein
VRTIKVYTIKDYIPEPTEPVIVINGAFECPTFIYGNPEVVWQCVDENNEDTFNTLPYSKTAQPPNTRISLRIGLKKIAEDGEFLLVNDLFTTTKESHV